MGKAGRRKRKKFPQEKFTDTMTGVAWYQKEQWARLLQISDDRDLLEETWEEWHEFFNDRMEKLLEQGITVRRVIIDVEELHAWCKERGLQVNGESRAQFTLEKVVIVSQVR